MNEFINNYFKKRNEITIYQAVDKTIVSKILTMPNSPYRKVSFNSRKPDIVGNLQTNSGSFSIVFIGEVKGRGTGDFTNSEIGQVLDMSMELLILHSHRDEVLSFLTDGYRFQFFRVVRRGEGVFNYEMSGIFNKHEGWKVLFLKK